MRLASQTLFAAGVLLALTPVSEAAFIVQTIPISQTLGDFTPFDVRGTAFDPAAGFLDGVTLEILGTASPQVVKDNPPFPAMATLTTRLFVFPTSSGPDSFNVTLGSQVVPVIDPGMGGAATLTGADIAVDRTFVFTDLLRFVTGIGGSQSLVEYGFRTAASVPGAGSDLTAFTGTAILTYSYTVPEPVSGIAFGVGLLGLAWSRRRRG